MGRASPPGPPGGPAHPEISPPGRPAADAQLVRAHTARPGGPLFRFDPGWLYLGAGVVLLSATVLIPAVDDLAEAQWHRDRALAVERYRSERLRHYSDYLDALERRDPALVLSLAATQLNLAPADRRVMIDASSSGEPGSASVFEALEPRFTPVPPPGPVRSLLHRWATGDTSRLWLLAFGAMLVLIGLMPVTVPEGERVRGG